MSDNDRDMQEAMGTVTTNSLLFNVDRSSHDDISRLVEDALENVSGKEPELLPVIDELATTPSVDEDETLCASTEELAPRDDIVIEPPGVMTPCSDPGSNSSNTQTECSETMDEIAITSDFTADDADRSGQSLPVDQNGAERISCISEVEEDEDEEQSIRSCVSMLSLPESDGYSTPCAESEDAQLLENYYAESLQRAVNCLRFVT